MTTPLPAELADFPVTIELPVQWGDQDAFGHVNNTVYFRWYESARIAYFERLEMADQNSSLGLGPILAAIGSNYRRQVRFPDRVIIGSRVAAHRPDQHRHGACRLEHGPKGDRRRRPFATIVVFDYAAHEKREVPAPSGRRSSSWKAASCRKGRRIPTMLPLVPES